MIVIAEGIHFEKAKKILEQFKKSNKKYGVENGKLYPPYYCYRHPKKGYIVKHV